MYGSILHSTNAPTLQSLSTTGLASLFRNSVSSLVEHRDRENPDSFDDRWPYKKDFMSFQTIC
jgi:hypothetical protein